MIQRLTPYFLIHPVTIRTDQSIRQFGEYDISYEPFYVCGSSSHEGCEVGLHLIKLDGCECFYIFRFGFPVFNNETEYEVLIANLWLAQELGAHRILVYSDSQLVIQQVAGQYEGKDESMKKYLSRVQ